MMRTSLTFYTKSQVCQVRTVCITSGPGQCQRGRESRLGLLDIGGFVPRTRLCGSPVVYTILTRDQSSSRGRCSDQVRHQNSAKNHFSNSVHRRHRKTALSQGHNDGHRFTLMPLSTGTSHRMTTIHSWAAGEPKEARCTRVKMLYECIIAVGSLTSRSPSIRRIADMRSIQV